jgi:hypothetical protein
MYLKIHLHFCIGFTDVQERPDDDQDRQKNFGFMTNCVKIYDYKLVYFRFFCVWIVC